MRDLAILFIHLIMTITRFVNLHRKLIRIQRFLAFNIDPLVFGFFLVKKSFTAFDGSKLGANPGSVLNAN
jgi:hypothetical protein